MKSNISALVLATAALAITGCATKIVRSDLVTKAAADTTDDAERGGLVYSLPMTVISVTGTKDTNGKVTYAITPSILPDPNARYRLKFLASGMADEDLNLGVDNNGLLTSTKANAFDRTGDIIVAIAQTVAAGGQPAATPPVPGITAAPPTDPYPFTVIYDVEDFTGGGDLVLPDNATIHVTSSPRLAEKKSDAACDFSVCFRTVVPIRARIVPASAPADKRVNDFAFVAVDPNSTEGIDLKTASLVNRTNLVTFTSGLINSVQVNQPSTTLAIVSLPLTVLKAILRVPAELLQLKITNVQDQATLVQQQANLLTQMKALMDAQAALDTARNANRSNRAVTGTGTSPP